MNMTQKMLNGLFASLLFLGMMAMIMTGPGGAAQDRPLLDSEPPEFSNFVVDPSPETGSTSTFYVDVTDDVMVNGSTVSLDYKGSTDSDTTSVPMSWDSGYTYSCSLFIGTCWTDMTYRFSAKDTSNNTGVSEEQKSDVKDVITPTLDYDRPDSAGYTGDDYQFYFIVADNIGVTDVELTYWFGDGSGTTVHPDVSEGGGDYEQECSYSITIGEGSLHTLHYEVTVEDVAGNVEGPLKTVDVEVYDNDPPVLSKVYQDKSAVTGGVCTFSVYVTDNIDLDEESVVLDCMDVNDGYYSSVAMEDLGSGWFEHTLDIEEHWTELYYYASAQDGSGNSASTGSGYGYVYDNISPQVLDDLSDTEAFTGDRFGLNFVVRDNTYIDSAQVTYWFGWGDKKALDMNIYGNGYGEDQRLTGQVRMPSDSLSTFYYQLDIYDRDGNWDGTSAVSVVPVDNDPPTVDVIDNPRATTGDGFHFNIGISDNIDGTGIREAHVLYSYDEDRANAVNISLEVDGAGVNWVSEEIILDLYTPGPLTYHITAVDSAGNWMDVYSVQTIDDDDLPEFSWPDSGPSSGTTGDPVHFSLEATDNIAIESVYVVPEYEDGTRIEPVMLVEGPSNTYSGILPLSRMTLSNMNYHYVVTDTSGNTVSTPFNQVLVTDNDPPEVISDMSRKEAAAGSEYLFKTILRDNIEVRTGWVEYWFSYDDVHVRKELQCLSKGLYYYKLPLSFKAGTLYYIFECEDVFGHSSTSTDVKEVRIVDSVAPLLSELDHPDTARTGDLFTVSVRVTDDVALDQVRLYYAYSDGPEGVEPSVGSEDEGLFTFSFEVRHMLATLRFWIEAVDAVGNPASTEMVEVPVVDDDLPVLGEDGSDKVVTTGDTMLFRVSVVDNVQVASVRVVYELPGSEPVTMDLVGEGSAFFGSISIPNDMKGTMRYRFRAEDTSGNIFLSQNVMQEIVDDEVPVALITGPNTVDQFSEVTFSGIGSTDNVGIVSYTWTIAGEVHTGPEVVHLFDEAGTYEVELIVSDGTTPSSRAFLTMTVRDVEHPTISMLVPERLGNHLVLLLDASGSTDNVGIVSYHWTVIMPDHTQRTSSEPSFELAFEGVLGEVGVYLTVRDAKGNTARMERTVQMVDELPPVVVERPDMYLLSGDLVLLKDLGSTDNTGISEYRWTVEGPQGTNTFFGTDQMYHFSLPGEYRIRLTLTDSSGNEAFDDFIVTVKAPDASVDSDDDGMPDVWEDLYGLDRSFNDAAMDPDRDTLSNKEEYILGTDPFKVDTDDDGLPDDWEVLYGFDPKWNDDSSGDPDGDGWINLDEYIRDMDPNVSDTVKERTDLSLLAIGAVIVLIILLVAGLLVASVYLTKFDHGKE